MEFKETPFGTEIEGLSEEINHIGKIGLLQSRIAELEQRNRELVETLKEVADCDSFFRRHEIYKQAITPLKEG